MDRRERGREGRRGGWRQRRSRGEMGVPDCGRWRFGATRPGRQVGGQRGWRERGGRVEWSCHRACVLGNDAGLHHNAGD